MEVLDYIITFFKDFVRILAEMSPYLLLGFFFAGLLYSFVPQSQIEKYFSGKPLRSSVLSSIFGIPLPLCSCGVIPTGMAFYSNGASKGGTVSFLISTPQTGVDSILATFSLMGLPFAIIRPIAALVTGITGGLVTSVITKNEEHKIKPHTRERQKRKFSQKIYDVFKYGFVDFIQDISKWLVIGLFLAAIISAIIPDNFFDILALPPLVQMLLVLAVSIPLYICATGSIPLAAVLILKGLSPGAAFVLLMAGPATNAATITMIGKVMGKRSLFAYLATIIAGALGFGLLIDYILPINWFIEMTSQQFSHHHDSGLPIWQLLSAITLSALIINGYIQKYRKSKSNSTTQLTNNKNNMETKTIKIEGMTCNHCKTNVENNLQNLPFIKTAKVDLGSKTVTLEGDGINIKKVKETIESIGYKPID